MNSYPNYRETGKSWNSFVPSHWQDLPGLAVLKEKQIKNKGNIEKTVLSLSYGRIVVKSQDKLHGLVPESFDTYQIVEPDDIVIRSTDLQNDKVSLRVGKVCNKGIITSAYMCLMTKNSLNSDYGYHLLHGYDLMKVFYGMGSGLRQNLSWADFRRLIFHIPPPEEQTQIARYLDWKTAQINKFIQAKKRMIELLKEKKQAIINDAVTGKIDVRTGKPYLKYKNSRVEWTGKVPEGWEILPLRWQISIGSGEFRPGELIRTNQSNTYQYPVIGGNGILGYTNDYNFQNEVIIIGRVGALCGNVHFINELVWITDNALRITHIKLINPVYLMWLLKAMNINKLANANAQPLVTGSIIKAQKILSPPNDIQKKICAYLEVELSKIDLIISRTELEISLIGEYRNRIISDLVTGKVDVRGIEIPGISDDEILFEENIEIAEIIEDEELKYAND